MFRYFVVASILSGSFVEVCIAVGVLCVFPERPDKTFEKAFLCGFVEHWWEPGRLDEQLVCPDLFSCIGSIQLP